MEATGWISSVVAVGVAVLASGLIGAAGTRATHRENPPLGHTGGFGEPTCAACHLSYPEESASSGWRVEGLPDAYRPGERYPLTFILEDEWMSVAGFQAALRFDDGEPAGTLSLIGPRVSIGEGENGVSYVHQTVEGSRPDAGRIVWTVEWSAPSGRVGGVSLHATANAANGDDSPLEDQIYRLEARTGSASGR